MRMADRSICSQGAIWEKIGFRHEEIEVTKERRMSLAGSDE
jgi:hypothetical protein